MRTDKGVWRDGQPFAVRQIARNTYLAMRTDPATFADAGAWMQYCVFSDLNVIFYDDIVPPEAIVVKFPNFCANRHIILLSAVRAAPVLSVSMWGLINVLSSTFQNSTSPVRPTER